MIRRGEIERHGFLPDGVEVCLTHVRQQQVLLVRDTQLAEAVAVGEIGDGIHLVGGRVARAARRFS